MTLTDWLLLALVLVGLARLLQAHQQHRALVAWLDALGDMLGDQLRALQDK